MRGSPRTRALASLAWVCVIASCEGASVHEDAPASAPPDAMPCEAMLVTRVSGRVLDAAGAPIAGARAQLCVRLAPDDRLLCLEPPFTDGEGEYTIEVVPGARCMRAAAMRVLVSGGTYGTSYCPANVGSARSGELQLTPIELFEVERAALPPLGDPSLAREVSLGDALAVELVPSTFGSPEDYARLGAVRVAPSRSCVPAAQALDGLLVSAPEGEVGGRFRVLDSGLTPGSRVVLHVIGGLDTRLADGTPIAEAELGRIGEGVVEADGTITPEPTVLLPQLGWLGWSVE